MIDFPNTLDLAIAQACEATTAALADGYKRLQVELVFSELKAMPIAEQFLDIFADYGSHLKVYFPDAGAAALARRDWGPMAFEIRGIGELKGRIQPDDQIFLLVEPSAVEVGEVEKLCEEVGDRPVVLLNPRLEEVATIGIGYAGRQLRERFLNTFESCYYLRPLEGAALLRAYPSPWQVWLEKSIEDRNEYQVIAELPTKPVGDDLDQLLAQAMTPSASTQPSQPGLFKGLERFLKALNQ